MMERRNVNKEDLRKVLNDRDDLIEEYGPAIELMGMFETDALKEVAGLDSQ